MEHHFIELIKKPNLDFIGKRHYAFIFSAITTLLGVICLMQVARGQANLGIEFAGGAAIQVKFSQPVSLATVRDALDKHNLRDAELQLFTGGDRVLIRLKKSPIPTGQVSDNIQAVFLKEFPQNRFYVEGSSEVGPAIGKKLQTAALWAVLISILGIIIYIAWRFELKFGVAAAIATFHDVLAVLGVFWIMNKEITLLIVTALLTLAGYSLTDTVVVFDRIRENLRGRRKEKEELGQTINRSINEVLSRTIITSMTVFLVLLALYFLGGEVLRDFSLALLMGIVVGTYSSVFVASPIVYEWRIREKAKGKRKKGKI